MQSFSLSLANISFTLFWFSTPKPSERGYIFSEKETKVATAALAAAIGVTDVMALHEELKSNGQHYKFEVVRGDDVVNDPCRMLEVGRLSRTLNN